MIKILAPFQTNATMACVCLVQTSVFQKHARIIPIAQGKCALFGRLMGRNIALLHALARQAVPRIKYVPSLMVLVRLAFASQPSAPMALRLAHHARTKTPVKATCASVAFAHTFALTLLCAVLEPAMLQRAIQPMSMVLVRQIPLIQVVFHSGKPARKTEDKPSTHLYAFQGIVTLVEVQENV
jgi:hypothetical protein